MHSGAFEIMVLLIVIGLPILAGVTVVALIIYAVTRRRPNSAEDMAAIRDLFDGLTKMERRIASVETILVERHRRE